MCASLVQQDRLDLFRRQAGQQSGGHENQRTKMAQNRRRVRQKGFHQQNRAPHAQFRRELCKFLPPCFRRGADAAATLSPHRNKTSGARAAEKEYADHPEVP
jgi:hypothetical protein